MFLALTLILALSEISFSRRRPRPRSRTRPRSRSGLAHQGTDEYLDGDDCNPKIYACDEDSYEDSYEELNVRPPPNNGNGR